MKLYKMLMILVVLTLCAVGMMWTMGLVGGAEATESLNKVISLIVILGVGIGALFAITSSSQNKSKENSDSNQQGPKF